MDSPLSVNHSRRSITWAIVHGLFLVGHTQELIPWTIVYGPLSVGHTPRVDTMDYST